MNECRFKDIVLKNDGFLRGPFGSALKKSLFVPKSEQTYKVYEQSVVLQNNPNLGKYYISKEYFEKNMSRFEVKKGDFLVSCSGVNYGTICYLNSNIEKGVINQALLRIRLDERKVYPLYFLYYFKSYIGKVITSGTGDSTIPNFPSMSIVKEIPIDLPTYSTQMYIGDLLNNISNKIAMNNKIISELESMAKTLYDYWFLQFDFPDENGKPYKSSGGKMVYNEELKREIPEGWEVKELGVLFSSNRGVSYNSETLKGEGVPMINLASFTPTGNYNVNGIKSYSGEYSDEKKLKPFDLVMCNTQQTAIDFSKDIIGRAMLVPDIFDGDIVSSHHVTSIKVYNENMKYFLCYLFNSQYFHKYVTGYANGTNILGLLFDGVERYKTEMPTQALLSKFAAVILNAEQKKSLIIKENRDLASLRDFLLPMLMNGQVTFKDAAEAHND